jgi:hypothetical protein
MVHLLFVGIVLLAACYSFEIRLPRFARDRYIARRVPSSFRKALELVHGICVLQYAGLQNLKIVSNTMKIQQHVRIREAQPHHLAHDDGGEGILVTGAC